MSHILEALRKSERERDLGNIASLALLDSYPAAPRRRWDFWVAMGLIIANGMALAFILESASGTARALPNEGIEAPASHSSIDEQPMVLSPAGEKKPVFQEASAGAPLGHVYTRSLDIDDVKRLDQARREQRLVQNRASPRQDAAVASSHTADTKRSFEGSSQIATVPANVPALAPLTDATPVALLEEMDPSVQGSLTPLSLDVHVYGENVQDRFVLINQKKYRTGEWTANGAMIEAIRADGVVLLFQGNRFRLVSK